MASLGHKYKPGSHWTQKPENRERLAAISRKMHRGRRKAIKQSKAEKIVHREVKRGRPRTQTVEDTSILLNGWRLTLSHNSLKIEKS